MSVPAAVWLGIAVGSAALLLIVVVALVRQGILVARTTARFAREAAEARGGPGASAGRRSASG